MDEWMDGRTGGLVDGWMDGWMDGHLFATLPQRKQSLHIINSMSQDIYCNVCCYVPVLLQLYQNYLPEKNLFLQLDVRGSVHYSIIHIKNPASCNSVSKFYFIFI